MSNETPAGLKATISGWIKAGITSIVGLISGVFIMYLTPVVNNVIKPAKPVANFATQITGLNAEFNNRSTGGVQGWWDFGDGTALEPFDPKADIVKHPYAKAGTYSVKLTLSNLIGDESDRTAPVVVDTDTLPAPEITVFELIPLGFERAPCTYQLVSQVKNATFSILSVGDSRPMEVIEDAVDQKRYITYPEMGTFTVRFAAFNGKQLVEKTKTIFVGASDSTEPMAKLLVSYEAVRVHTLKWTSRIQVTWPADAKTATVPFRKEHIAEQGHTIASAELVNQTDKDAPRNLKVEVAPDKTKFILSGDIVNGSPPWLAQIKVSMERRSKPRTINRGEVALAVNLNGSVAIPMQPLDAGWEMIRKQVTLQLWDGSHKVWEGNTASSEMPITLKNQPCLVSVTPQSDSMLVRIAPVGPIRPVSFQRTPLLPK